MTGRRADDAYRATLIVAAAAVVLTLAGIALVVGRMAWPALLDGPWSFLVGRTWNPVTNTFGALPALYGTLLTSAVALAIAVPLSFGVALFLTEVAPRRLADAIAPLIDLLAAIPSVIYGLWGIFVLAPLMREHVGPVLKATLGWLPLFAGEPIGVGYLTAGVILAIMITPVITSVAREVLEAVPRTQREAAIGLGATPWEVVRGAVFPAARSGLVGAVVLGLGRALGETMAVTMVIGNRFDISASLFAPGYTLAAVIANEFSEAFSPEYLAALAGLGMVLLGTTLLLNAGARLLVARVRAGAA
ncbi:MAG TPA: phosphate ABC transporter permease subunit PstC [Myxococcota bacterium]|nr:phosphate ABC transporter permease subunit PstC [Myxococcota bacterium]